MTEILPAVREALDADDRKALKDTLMVLRSRLRSVETHDRLSCCLLCGSNSVIHEDACQAASIVGLVRVLMEREHAARRQLASVHASYDPMRAMVREWVEAHSALDAHLETSPGGHDDDSLGDWNELHDILYERLEKAEQALAATALPEAPSPDLPYSREAITAQQKLRIIDGQIREVSSVEKHEGGKV